MCTYIVVIFDLYIRGFVKVKKNPRKTRKWVGCSCPHSDFFFFNFVFFMLPNVFQKKLKKMDKGWVGVI